MSQSKIDDHVGALHAGSTIKTSKVGDSLNSNMTTTELVPPNLIVSSPPTTITAGSCVDLHMNSPLGEGTSAGKDLSGVTGDPETSVTGDLETSVPDCEVWSKFWSKDEHDNHAGTSSPRSNDGVHAGTSLGSVTNNEAGDLLISETKLGHKSSPLEDGVATNLSSVTGGPVASFRSNCEVRRDFSSGPRCDKFAARSERCVTIVPFPVTDSEN